MNQQFYHLRGENTESFGVAYAPKSFNSRSVPADKMISDWGRIELNLQRGVFTDFLGCNLIWRLCSEKMKRTIDRFDNSIPGLQWLDVIVSNSAGIQRSYSVLHLTAIADVLDRDKSTFVADGRLLAKPVLDSTKLADVAVFRLDKTNVDFIVRQDVKDALERADCTGMDFEQVKQSADFAASK